LKGTSCVTLYHGLRIDPSLTPSGCSRTSWISSEQSLGPRPNWWFKGKTNNETTPQVWLTFLDPVWYLGQPRNNTLLHIDINHHFLRDSGKKGLISVNFCDTKNQIADIFTKVFSREQFEKNMLELGLIKII